MAAMGVQMAERRRHGAINAPRIPQVNTGASPLGIFRRALNPIGSHPPGPVCMLEAARQFAEDHTTLLWSVGIASIVIFFASLLIMPALVIRIPVDYFNHAGRPPSRFARLHPAARLALRIGKNVLGGLLLMAGVAMLVLPGQGLLTILVGFLLLDFPRKYHFERWLVRKRAVHRPINWLRRRHHREPLRLA